MRRRKRFAITRIALGLAVVAIVPVTAEAKPLPTGPSTEQYRSQVEIPYLSHGQGLPAGYTGTLSADDRPVTVVSGADINPYWATGFGLAIVLLAGGMGVAVRHSRNTRLSTV